MNSRRFFEILKGQGSDQKGVVLVVVLSFVALMVLSTVMFTGILKRDIELIGRAKLSEQAKNVAEAGVNHAIAKLIADGFDSRTNFNGSLDTGTYSVTYSSSGDRVLVASVGTVSGVSRTVSAELENRFPTALLKMFAGGNDIKARASSSDATISIIGDIHANNDVELRAVGGGGTVSITGAVSAVGIVQEGSQHDADDSLDDDVSINGAVNDTAIVTEGADRVKYPSFEYDTYKQEAIAAGTYYSGNTTFDGDSLSGIIYVDGNVKITGTVNLTGGLVGDDIDIVGTLNQTKNVTGDRNFILAKDMDILINEELLVEEAIVYAKRDLRTRAAGTSVNITGIVLAERDMSFWNVQTTVTYVYKLTHPSDLAGTDEKDMIHVVSWNR